MHPRRCWQWGLLLLALLVLLVGCGGGQSHTPTASPTRPQATATATLSSATATPGVARVPYPWQMDQINTGLSTVYRPHDRAVWHELQADFWTFWVWAGYQPPTSFPFLPSAAEIPQFAATPAFASQLATYVQQIQANGRLTSYTGPQLIQSLHTCTPDGLQCQVGYALGVTVKTVFDATTGAVQARTADPTFYVSVAVEQDYNQRVMQWQLATLTITESVG